MDDDIPVQISLDKIRYSMDSGDVELSPADTNDASRSLSRASGFTPCYDDNQLSRRQRDLWSLGYVLLHLSGAMPWEETNGHKREERKIRYHRKLNKDSGFLLYFEVVNSFKENPDYCRVHSAIRELSK